MIEEMSQSLFYALLAGSAKGDAGYFDAFAELCYVQTTKIKFRIYFLVTRYKHG